MPLPLTLAVPGVGIGVGVGGAQSAPSAPQAEVKPDTAPTSATVLQDVGANRLTQLLETPPDQFQVSTSYSPHFALGVYVSTSVAYVKNPGFAGRYRGALNAGLNPFLEF